jgi:hypothetical protein
MIAKDGVSSVAYPENVAHLGQQTHEPRKNQDRLRQLPADPPIAVVAGDFMQVRGQQINKRGIDGHAQDV